MPYYILIFYPVISTDSMFLHFKEIALYRPCLIVDGVSRFDYAQGSKLGTLLSNSGVFKLGFGDPQGASGRFQGIL